MKIGIILEGKTPPDKRVPFTPKQCKIILESYPNVELFIQKSTIRAFEDALYAAEGLNLVDSLENADIIFGVKEVNVEDLIPNKTHFFFSHTIKEQPYNRDLLQAVIDKNVQLVDYEVLTQPNGRRLVGFGRYAGIVGTYNAFIAYGHRTKKFNLKPANLCADRSEMEGELPNIELPNNFKIVLTGLGRVAGGAIEVLNKMGVKKVDPTDFINKSFKEPVFTQLSVQEYFKKLDDSSFERKEAYDHPSRFESDFRRFSEVANMYIPCHYWDAEAPFIFTKQELMQGVFNIEVIADISCDIAGPIPSTIRPSTISYPLYEVDKSTLQEVTEITKDTITVMAVDNLPCELPKDASEDFGGELLKNILPALLGNDPDNIIDRASIVKNGDLNSHFEYLRNYLNGK
ncbi:MAG: NAD(P)-dependent oxidoreductase [Vicingaceae bacterium]|jgi:saccharopine dehydrogenase (NAD+, L-lysine-forming)